MTRILVGSLSSFVLLAGIAQADGGGLGKVQFQNSCSPAVQAKLQRGVAMLHSFYYTAARRVFEEVGQEDNNCVIAAWGFASILMNNPLAGAGAAPKDVEAAHGAIEKGRKMSAKTQRERDYLEAVAVYYEDFGKRTERERQVARANAYEKLAAKYPDDDEAQVFYAVYLSGTQLQTDQTYAAYLKAAKILEEQFKKHPAASRRRALPHPQLRRAADREARHHGGTALCRDRARRAARAAHALAHLHARRRVGRLGRDQPALGRGGEQGQGARRRLRTRSTTRRTPICSSRATATRAR